MSFHFCLQKVSGSMNCILSPVPSSWSKSHHHCLEMLVSQLTFCSHNSRQPERWQSSFSISPLSPLLLMHPWRPASSVSTWPLVPNTASTLCDLTAWLPSIYFCLSVPQPIPGRERSIAPNWVHCRPLVQSPMGKIMRSWAAWVIRITPIPSLWYNLFLPGMLFYNDYATHPIESISIVILLVLGCVIKDLLKYHFEWLLHVTCVNVTTYMLHC